MKNLPKTLYVRIEKPVNDEPYPVAAASMLELGIDVGDTAKIGIYALVETCYATGIVQTSNERSIRK